MSFRVSAQRLPLSEYERDVYGRPPLTRAQIWKLSMGERLSMVAKALIMYSHWFPNMVGFDEKLLHMPVDNGERPPH